MKNTKIAQVRCFIRTFISGLWPKPLTQEQKQTRKEFYYLAASGAALIAIFALIGWLVTFCAGVALVDRAGRQYSYIAIGFFAIMAIGYAVLCSALGVKGWRSLCAYSKRLWQLCERT